MPDLLFQKVWPIGSHCMFKNLLAGLALIINCSAIAYVVGPKRKNSLNQKKQADKNYQIAKAVLYPDQRKKTADHLGNRVQIFRAILNYKGKKRDYRTYTDTAHQTAAKTKQSHQNDLVFMF